MEKITLFDQGGITVSLCDVFFDTEIDGARAVLEINNQREEYADILLGDIWQDEIPFEWEHTLEYNVPPHKTVRKNIWELAGEDEEERVLRFHQGYIRQVLCRVCVYLHNYSDDDCKQYYGKGNRIIVKKMAMNGIEVLPPDTFQLETRGSDIAVASDYYIPFEISKAKTEKTKQIQCLKNELIDRLLSIQAYRDDVLVAQYAEAGSPRFYDVENMCIYNLGTSAFSKCCQSDIAFMELPKRDIENLCNEFCLCTDKKYYYAYRQIHKDFLIEKIAAKQVLAQWEKVYIDTDFANAPKRYWMSLRKQVDKIEVLGNLSDPRKDSFGMALTLHLPRTVYPASVMKPLLDGVVCAFHKSNGAEEVLKSFTEEEFAKLVQEAERKVSLLGEQNYVRSYRKSLIIWNPADERLKFAWVSVVQEETQPYFDGKLFAW